MQQPPDVVIVGAPKCGTTSLYTYLAGHSRICASAIKEPNYFCMDAPGLRVVDSWPGYLHMFRSAGPEQLRLEASTAYLLSRVAVEAILKTNPRAKFIAAVRDPIEMIVSYHAQKLYAFEEDQADFAVAWELSPQRARGERVGARCRAPAYLDYRSVARLGEQVARLTGLVPADQLMIVLFDDLHVDAEGAYRRALRFLGLPPETREGFEVTNARKTHAWPALARFVVQPPPLLAGAKRAARRAFPALTKRAGQLVHGLIQRPTPKAGINPELRHRLAEELRPDVEQLARLVQRDLSGWMGGAADAHASLRRELP